MSTSWHSAGSSTRKPVMRQSRSSTRRAVKARVFKLARSHPTSRASRSVIVANVLSGSATRFRTQLSMERLVADRPSRFSSPIVLRAIAISGPRKRSSPRATGGSTGRSGLRRSLNSCFALPRVIGLECNVCKGRRPRAIIRRLGHGCPTRSPSGGLAMRLSIALLAALLISAHGAEAQQTVKIGTTPSFVFLPLYVAEQLGYFKAEGITAQFVDFEGGAEVTTAMVGGSIDAGGTMVERPLILAEKGFGAKNLVALENRNPLHVVLRANHPAKEVKDLKGSRLGMTRAGSGTHLSLRALLKDAGLEPDRDVAIIAIGGVSSANAALKAGQVDGFMGGEPATAIAVHQLKLARYFLDPRMGQGPKFLQFMTFPTVQVSDRFIQANPQAAEKIVRAIVKTLKRMREDPEAAVRVGQKLFPTLDVSIIRSIITIEKNTYFPQITEEAVHQCNQAQKQLGVLKGDIAYDKR